MSKFRVVRIVTVPEEFGYTTSVNPLVPMSEVRDYFLGKRVHSRIAYDSSRPEGFEEYEIETPYVVTQVDDLGLQEF